MDARTLRLGEFPENISSLSEREQLELCQTVFRNSSRDQELLHQAVFRAWKWVEDHQLYRLIKKDRLEYWEAIDAEYSISPIVDEVKRKNKLRTQIESHWHASVEQCLGPLCPPNPSRNLLEQLLILARHCPDQVIAKSLLGGSKEHRPLRSRTKYCIIVSDVERALKDFQSQQHRSEQALRKSSLPYQNLPQPKQASSTRKRRKSNSRQPRRRFQNHNPRNGEAQFRPSVSFPEEDSSDSATEPELPESTALDHTSILDGAEHQRYGSVLRQFAPYHIPDMMTKLFDELGRHEQEIEEWRKMHPGEIWGEYNIQRIRKVLRVAKPVRIYVEGVSAGVRFGIYKTASREDADVLCLDPDAAARVLSQGPVDGKPVFVRNHVERQSLTAEELLSHIERFRVEDVDTQDPGLSTMKDFLQRRSPTDITMNLRRLLDDRMTTGYGEGQIPPFNLLSLPKISSRQAACLAQSESTQILKRLRSMNYIPGSPGPESDSGTILSAHLALALAHVDGNGFGLNEETMFGYKIWIVWPECLGENRSKFHRQGNTFHGRGARYILLAPGDEYTQTPCITQDIHAVVTIGYCGVTRCLGECTLNGQPQCCGLAALDYQSYWSEPFIPDSLQSIIDSIEWKNISSDEPSIDLEHLLDHIEVLMERDSTFLGNSEVRQRFTEKKEEYLRKRHKRKHKG